MQRPITGSLVPGGPRCTPEENLYPFGELAEGGEKYVSVEYGEYYIHHRVGPKTFWDAQGRASAFLGELHRLASTTSRADEAMVLAAENGDLPALRQAVSDGANVNLDDGREWTLLSWACAEGKIECTQELLRLKADPNLVGNDGDTAIYKAINADIFYKESTLALLKAKADPNFVSTSGLGSVLDYATSCARPVICRLLINAGATLDSDEEEPTITQIPFYHEYVLGEHYGPGMLASVPMRWADLAETLIVLLDHGACTDTEIKGEGVLEGWSTTIDRWMRGIDHPLVSLVWQRWNDPLPAIFLEEICCYLLGRDAGRQLASFLPLSKLERDGMDEEQIDDWGLEDPKWHHFVEEERPSIREFAQSLCRRTLPEIE